METGINWNDPLVRQIIQTLVVLGVFALLIRIGRRLASRYIDDPARRFRASRTVSRTFAVVAFVLIVVLWSSQLGSLATLLTVIGAGLAIALREVLLSVAGWMLILIRRLFEQGDRIEVNGLKGDVLDIRVQYTTVMEVGAWVAAEQSTGRMIHIPNSQVLLHPVHNYTRGFRFIWNELYVTLTFRSDWHAAQEILYTLAGESAEILEKQASEEIRNLSHEYLIHYSIMTPFVYVRIMDYGIRLTVRFLCEARKRRGIEHALAVRILEEFQAHGGIEFAYPAFGIAELRGPQFGSVADAAPAPDPDTGAQSLRHRKS